MNAVRVAACLFVAASSLAIACGDSDTSIPSESSTSTSTSTSTSGGVGSSGTGTTTSSGIHPAVVGRVDPARVQTLTIGKDTCMKPEGACLDAQSFTIDFAASSYTHTTCVELAGPDAGLSGGTQDATTRGPLTVVDLERIREALAAVRVAEGPHPGFDGEIDTLEVSIDGNTFAFSAPANCGDVRYQVLTEGFDGLWTTVSEVVQ
ncbi:MAG: hypothetical protein KIT84_20380 [Labilithrix sp.]|nr:hypothetical protein [Labilithrix sp.]MCW5813397.1 hypothetical protein [Labilithrix sp.]